VSLDVDAYADRRTKSTPRSTLHSPLWCVEPDRHLPHGRLVLPSVPEPQTAQPNQKELICRGIQILEEGVM